MLSDYKKITEENIKKYGTDIDRYGPILLANLYSDRTHFVYELLQNAEDAKAKRVNFSLFKNRLEIRHNGRLFNESDVQGICGLVQGTKKEDLTQIGKFGIGFKSVYAYTSTPQIYSGGEAFCIENYVQPRSIEKFKVKDDETAFIFPFNHKDVSSEEAFVDISKRLSELGSRTLLFLSNIDEINWNVEGGESGTYIREVKSKGEHSRRVYILSEVGTKKDVEEDWLIFSQPITDNPRLKVEVAFKISRKNKNEIITPVNDSYLVVFSPTEKETHLKFLIQGPYRTTPARDNIPKNDKWNIKLIEETARLVAESIVKIKEMGLLDVNFLNILPISEENFPKDHMFRLIYEEVLNKLKSDEELLPANSGEYISAKQAFLGRGGELIELLDTKQLSLLFEKQDCQWLDSSITQDKMSELRKYLTSQLVIQEIDPSTFANKFSEQFIDEQDDEWVIRLYKFLKERNALWGKNYYSAPLRKRPFIRLEDNSHVAPFNSKDKPLAYLPSNSNSYFPTVKRSIANDKEAREFLKELDLKEPDAIAEVIEHTLPKYKQSSSKSPEEDNLKDVKQILQALETDSIAKKKNLIDELNSTPFFLSFNHATGETLYKKPSEVYLSNSGLETYFKGYDKAFFPYKGYKNLDVQEKLSHFLSSLALMDKPRRIEFKPQLSLKEKEILRGEQGFTYDLPEENKDYDIDGLENFMGNNLTSTNAVILWQILLNHLRDLNYQWRLDTFFEGQYCWFYRSKKNARFDAKFLKTLRQHS